MTLELLQKRLKRADKYKFKINDNRSTMLSVKWEPDCTRVSLHRMFLNAPQEVLDELAQYLKREQKNISTTIREFIEANLRQLDYSHLLQDSELQTEGNVYDLLEIYERLNREYFDNMLNLKITWFGKHAQKTKSQVTFGLFHEQLKLIKINRIMDSVDTPGYVIDFVIYHEMVHSVCPGHFDEQGRHRVHSRDFKALERQFAFYKEASLWLKNNYFNHVEMT